LRCTGRTLRSEPSPHLAGEAALPSQNFNERHRDRQCLPRLAVPPRLLRVPVIRAPTCRIGLAPGQWRTAQAHSRANRRRNPRSPPIITVTSWVQPENRPDFRPRKPCLARHPRLLTPEPQGPCSLLGAFRRGGRVVECTALEMRHRCKPIGGSNPSLSANIIRHNKTAYRKLVDQSDLAGSRSDSTVRAVATNACAAGDNVRPWRCSSDTGRVMAGRISGFAIRVGN
jgi:hypothetical protein